ncbi:NAD-P-binding protein [Trametes coccinea BRFM310]|uniref:NAD-P-binding protein n=1 Tax=Trametes coccinea (strain BRFM310) TaxID=1353009 RepID=A0A1Y2IYM4_TRAC3|nr:NAD-P-binding protein [Trametes coccinea BRFM310]
MSAQQKVVLVTGCSDGGIGSELCKQYAAKGCKVYATARRIEAMGSLTHPNIACARMDVTDEASIKAVVDEINEKEGRIDVLVNNAGLTCSGPTAEVDMERIQRTYDTNVFGIIRAARIVIPHMAARKSGTIVNIGSILGETPLPFAGIYASTKAAVRSLSETLYMECLPLGISVVHVNTGGARTNIVKNMGQQFSVPSTTLYAPYEEVIREEFNPKRVEQGSPPEHIARVVVEKSIAAKPDRYISVGAGSFLVDSILPWIPRGWLLRMLWNFMVEKKKTTVDKSK